MNSLVQTKKNMFLDLGIFIGFLFAMEPMVTGMSIHEWLGLALAGALIFHVIFHWRWVVTATTRFFQTLPGKVRLNYVLNILLFIAFVLIIVSGLLISKTFGIGESLGLGRDALRPWNTVHSVAADISFLIVAMHLALHWTTIVRCVSRTVFNRPGVEHSTRSGWFGIPLAIVLLVGSGYGMYRAGYFAHDVHARTEHHEISINGQERTITRFSERSSMDQQSPSMENSGQGESEHRGERRALSWAQALPRLLMRTWIMAVTMTLIILISTMISVVGGKKKSSISPLPTTS